MLTHNNSWKNIANGFIVSASIGLLSGCSDFNGIRTPLYDGEPIELNEESATVYGETREVIGAEREFYFRYAFSEDIYLATLDFPEEDPVLLEEGSYEIGEDIPSGRVNFLGNQSDFTVATIHVGNMIIRDESGEVYFENHFNAAYGPLHAQVDLHEGHTIEVIGTRPEITVFYEEVLPENPYILMDPPEQFAYEDEIEGSEEEWDESISSDDPPIIHLGAGIWEVGVHLDEGIYAFYGFSGQRQSELYLFRENEETRVFEMTFDIIRGASLSLASSLEELEMELASGAIDQVEYDRRLAALEGESAETAPTIELKDGDKVYPNMMSALQLEQID